MDDRDADTRRDHQTSQHDNSALTMDPVPTAVTEGSRLYVGNLAYAATEQDVRSFFTDYDVRAVNIPVNPRTNRLVGYAFVSISPLQAEIAIASRSGQVLLERKISVAFAREPNDAKVELRPDLVPNPPKKKRKRNNEVEQASTIDKSSELQYNQDADDSSPQLDSISNTDSEPTPAEAVALALAEVWVKKYAGFGTGEEQQIEVLAGLLLELDVPHSKLLQCLLRTTQAPVETVHQRTNPTIAGQPSTTTVMVTNLPYDLSAERLEIIFSAYGPTNASIALRPIPRFMIKKLRERNEARKGRGFGFVTCENEKMQQRAIIEMDGKEIDGRPIGVKVAIDGLGAAEASPSL